MADAGTAADVAALLLPPPLAFRLPDPGTDQRGDGNRSLLHYTAGGDWRPHAASSLGCLICGFSWEMWNFYSYPKWIYDVPFVGFLRLFEMPLVGYLGYVVFAWELFALYHLLAGIGPGGAKRISSRSEQKWTGRIHWRRIPSLRPPVPPPVVRVVGGGVAGGGAAGFGGGVGLLRLGHHRPRVDRHAAEALITQLCPFFKTLALLSTVFGAGTPPSSRRWRPAVRACCSRPSPSGAP